MVHRCGCVIIILVIVSCTDLSLYFLNLFSSFIQLVPVLFIPACSTLYLLIFLKKRLLCLPITYLREHTFSLMPMFKLDDLGEDKSVIRCHLPLV